MARRFLSCVLAAVVLPAVAAGAGRVPSCRGELAFAPAPGCVQNCDASQDACHGKCSAALSSCLAQCPLLGFMCDYACRAASYGCRANCAKAHDACVATCPDKGGQQ
jgi:hypothetical protein